jgi:hypothetical protein
VRRHIWRDQDFLLSRRNHNVAKPKPAPQKPSSTVHMGFSLSSGYVRDSSSAACVI